MEADRLNIGLLVACCALAHLFPYHVLLLSYAVLGPAHYLTEIAWLHQRSYFVGRRSLPVVFAAPAALLVFAGSAKLSFLSLAVALLVSAAAMVAWSWTLVIGAVMVSVTATHLTFGISPGSASLMVVLLPSIVHVLLFTALFMVTGAKQSPRTGYLVVGVMAMCVATFFFISSRPSPPEIGADFFQPVANAIGKILPGHPAHEVFAFLGFAYSYHYLNWFSKVEVIKWNRVPKSHAATMAVIYIGMLAAYAWSFTLGFLLSAFLSMLHVLLEFPLNLKTISSLCRLDMLPALMGLRGKH